MRIKKIKGEQSMETMEEVLNTKKNVTIVKSTELETEWVYIEQLNLLVVKDHGEQKGID